MKPYSPHHGGTFAVQNDADVLSDNFVSFQRSFIGRGTCVIRAAATNQWCPCDTQDMSIDGESALTLPIDSHEQDIPEEHIPLEQDLPDSGGSDTTNGTTENCKPKFDLAAFWNEYWQTEVFQFNGYRRQERRNFAITRLIPLENSNGPKELMAAAIDIVRASQSLYERGGMIHGDISLNTMMYRKVTKGSGAKAVTSIQGVLIHFDLRPLPAMPSRG